MARKPKLKIKTRGFGEVLRKMEKYGEVGVEAVAAGLYAVGAKIMEDSVRRVPVDTNAMRGSQFVTLPDIGSRKIHVEAGYGGPSAAYVVEQHENTSLFHPNGGEAKFLERAVDEQRGKAKNAAAAAANKAFKRGGGRVAPTFPTTPNKGG